jgi:hypothetical protein
LTSTGLTVKEQQRPNVEMTAELAMHVRNLQPSGVEVSIGGEIGEIGKQTAILKRRAHILAD